MKLAQEGEEGEWQKKSDLPVIFQYLAILFMPVVRCV